MSSQRVSSCRLSISAIMGSCRLEREEQPRLTVPGPPYREMRQLQKIRAVLRKGRRSGVRGPLGNLCHSLIVLWEKSGEWEVITVVAH